MLCCTLKWVCMDNLSIDKRFIGHEMYLERHTRLIGTLGMGRARPSTRARLQELLRCPPRHSMCTRVLLRCAGATAHDNSATSKLPPGPGQGRGARVAPSTGDPQTGAPGAAQQHSSRKRSTQVSHNAARSSADAPDGAQSYLNQDIPSHSPETRPGSAPLAARHAPAEHIAQKEART